jgi:hypothetical protein
VQRKDVQAQLANGNLRARANLTSGALMPLAGSLNLMADRLMRLGQTNMYMHHLMRAMDELSLAFDRQAAGAPFVVPESCNEFIEINRLLLSMRIKRNPIPVSSTHPLAHMQADLARRPATIQQPVTQPFEHHRPDIQSQAHSSLLRRPSTPLPQTTSVARLGVRTVTGSRRLPSSEPLQPLSSEPLLSKKVNGDGV